MSVAIKCITKEARLYMYTYIFVLESKIIFGTMPRLPDVSKYSCKGPSLGDFLLKNQVKSQLRQCMRIVYRLPPSPQRREAAEEVKNAYRKHMDLTEPAQIKLLLTEGAAQKKHLENIIGSGHIPGLDKRDGSIHGIQHSIHSSESHSSKEQHDNEKIKQEEIQDVRHRVGSGWPWQSPEKHRKSIRPLKDLYGELKGRNGGPLRHPLDDTPER